MTNFIKPASFISIFFCLFAAAQAQTAKPKFTFEGKPIVVDVPDAGQSCSVRYGADPIITELDGSVPTDLTTCDQASRAVPAQNGKVIVRRDARSGYFCFQGPKEAYSITFSLGADGLRTYRRWLSKQKTETGYINVRDFGARGDGETDDTDALRNAIAFVAARQGGTLFFPPGNYTIGGNAEFKGLGLPSGIVLQGSTSLPSDALHNYFDAKQFSQIRVRRAGQTIFRIGECTTDVKIKNLALRADSNQKTYGIEAIGDNRGTPTNHVGAEDVSFSGFDIGFYVHNSDPSAPGWQFDIVRVEHCFFVYNRTAGIWIETYNTDWRISNSSFLLPAVAANSPSDAVKIKIAGAVLIENTFAGGISYQNNQRGGDFIDVDLVGPLTVLNSASERATNSLVYASQPGTGGYSYPLTLINNVFIDPVRVRRAMFVSTGNTYGARNVQTGDGAQIYSTGDRFCYDATSGYAPNETPPRYPCGDAATVGGGFQGEGKIVFQTGQLRDTHFTNPNIVVPERPLIIGTETQFNAPARLPSFAAAGLPPNRAAGSMVFCQDCQKNSSPCRAGGDGALAVSVGARWDCK